jgi:hypothetical protein
MTAARDARVAVGATSYARAIEQALWCAEAGIPAREVIAACGVDWPDRAPTWEDAVYVLAMSWRKHCADLPPLAVVPGGAAPAVPKAKHCLRCGRPLADKHRFLHPACAKAVRREAAAMGAVA